MALGNCLWNWGEQTSGMTIDVDNGGGTHGWTMMMAAALSAREDDANVGIPMEEDVGMNTPTAIATTTAATTTRARTRARGG